MNDDIESTDNYTEQDGLIQGASDSIDMNEYNSKKKGGFFLQSLKNSAVRNKMPATITLLGGLSMLFLLQGMSSSSNYSDRAIKHQSLVPDFGDVAMDQDAVDVNQNGIVMNDNIITDTADLTESYGSNYNVYSDPQYIASVTHETDNAKTTIEDLRFLSFGATNAITNGSPDWKSSYPYLLSSDPEKILLPTIGSVGPKYPSICTQSLIAERAGPGGNQEFDVIVLDYHMRAIDGLYELTKRLRFRYPNAIIILLRLWRPVHIVWYQDNAPVGNLKDWADSKNLEFGSAQFHNNLRDADVRWQTYNEKDKVFNQIQKDLDAEVFSMPQSSDPKIALWRYKQLFNKDFNHLSKAGHDFIHAGIDSILESKFRDFHLNTVVGTWGDGDECHSWFSSGRVHLERSRNTMVETFKTDNVQFALSTGTNDVGGSGWVVVNNRFDGPRNLILSYMVSGPPSMYPKTKIEIYPYQGDADPISNTLNPTTYEYGKVPVHDVHTKKVATIPPGAWKVVWTPLEETPRPFRLTGVHVVSTEITEGGVNGPHPELYYVESY